MRQVESWNLRKFANGVTSRLQKGWHFECSVPGWSDVSHDSMPSRRADSHWGDIALRWRFHWCEDWCQRGWQCKSLHQESKKLLPRYTQLRNAVPASAKQPSVSVQTLHDTVVCYGCFLWQDNWTALLNACKEGYHRAVQTLIDHGADIEHKDMVILIFYPVTLFTNSRPKKKCFTWILRSLAPLLLLALQGGWTGLMWACYKGRSEVARVLLENGANCNVKGEVCTWMWSFSMATSAETGVRISREGFSVLSAPHVVFDLGCWSRPHWGCTNVAGQWC